MRTHRPVCQGPTGRAPLVAALLLGLLLGLPRTGQFGPGHVEYAAADEQSQAAGLGNLHASAAAKGTVRVIVTLEVPAFAELTRESNRYRVMEPGRQFPDKGRRAGRALAGAIRSSSDAVLDALRDADTHVNHTYSALPYLALRVSSESLSRLETHPLVADISEDLPSRVPDIVRGGPVPPTLSQSTDLIGADAAWDMGYTGEGWAVAVLDTGIRPTHDFFEGKTIIEACFSSLDDCPNGQNEMVGPGSAAHYEDSYDGYDHGTHVAGIATGNEGSLFGVAKDSDIIAVQIFSRASSQNCGGSPCLLSWSSDQLKGLDYVYSLRATQSIAAVNMSLGGGRYSGPCDTHIQKAAIDNLRSVGIATAIASGNNGFCGSLSSPACTSTSIAVGASTQSDIEAGFNNWHPDLQDLFAPGVSILSSTGGSDSSYQSWNGTSMATPHVAGAWAILRQFDPDAGVAEILAALKATGPPIVTLCPGDASLPRIQLDEALTALGEAEFALLGPENGSLHSTAPVFEWAGGDYDLFGLYLLLPVFGQYQLIPIFVPDTSLGLTLYDPLWDFVSQNTWAAWRVLAVNTESGTWEASGPRWIMKLP